MAPHASDHLPIVLYTQKFEKHRVQGRKGFKFEEAWLLWEEYEDIFLEAWTMKDNGVHELALLKQKIQICGEQLRAWGSSKANPNNEEIKKLQNRMERFNMEEITEDSKVEFLGVSRALDDLLLKQ